MLAACSADVADAATRVEAMADVLGWGVVAVGATATGVAPCQCWPPVGAITRSRLRRIPSGRPSGTMRSKRCRDRWHCGRYDLPWRTFERSAPPA
jgi:hypothetical protein